MINPVIATLNYAYNLKRLSISLSEMALAMAFMDDRPDLVKSCQDDIKRARRGIEGLRDRYRKAYLDEMQAKENPLDRNQSGL